MTPHMVCAQLPSPVTASQMPRHRQAGAKRPVEAVWGVGRGGLVY